MKYFYPIFLMALSSFTAVAQDFSKTVSLSAGTPVIIKSGTELSASEITLKSTSLGFSSLFLEEALAPSVIVHYDRHVNLVGVSGVNGGNDLIAMPVSSATVSYSDFLDFSNGITTNRNVLPYHPEIPTTYAFGPYDNNVQKYINYDATINGEEQLKRGVGYRAAARLVNQTLRFTGTVSTITETVEITTVRKNRWNLIGNPYPTYLDSQLFLEENSGKLDPQSAALYGYNSGTNVSNIGTIGNFTIVNFETNSNLTIAPGQGFLVANKTGASNNQISFTTKMRLFSGGDDFILGRNENPNPMLRLKAAHDTAEFATEIYFNVNSTLGLDPGYDAALFDGLDNAFMIYSQLVKDNIGRNIAIQSLNYDAMNDVIIPLGLKTAKGKKVTFSIENNTLPEDIDIYLEDKLTNTFTLLTKGNYSFTAETSISGTGRFYIRMENKALSNSEKEISSLKIFASDQKLFINGLLFADTEISIYDIQGRLVLKSYLKAATQNNSINTVTLNSGIYVVKLANHAQHQTKKIVIK